MKNIFIPILLLTVLFTSQTYGQTEIGGVSLSDTLKLGDTSLVLNGGGIREKFWLDLYVGGLYLTQKESNAQAIIDANQPMAIYLEIVSGLITSEKMIEAVEDPPALVSVELPVTSEREEAFSVTLTLTIPILVDII